ncbi:cation:dicarboxylate symporter family transporter [Paraferrimonas sedimenticola]|uniref:Transmembrane symporter n=1 Tax=Paraferrimonas sedimenticola TaxID=375674 RepID=A0AA37RRK7_9GAMM|nr:cation:dicarboxylase symporter family transporter [Paraferrimonas sedimenticola]GLP95123.1 transmembrane symporter [Paraferrimonas sedimenticola]
MAVLHRIPNYVWTLLFLLVGLVLGGIGGESMRPVAAGTRSALSGFITLVPVLIFIALSPAVGKLISTGQGGRLAGGVILWYLLTSICAGLLGVMLSSLLFDIRFSATEGDLWQEALTMLSTLDGESGASMPILAILVAIIAGLLAHKVPPLQRLLDKFEAGMAKATPWLSRVMPVIVLFLGITLGVNIGAADSLKYYLLMTLYTFLLCVVWLALYQLVAVKLLAKQSVTQVLKRYFFPTAVFAAGTCSSLATLPVNLENAKKFGADPSVSNFVIPIGSVINLDTSALAYVAYAPFIMTVVFDVSLTWTALLVAWPAIVIFTIAAPGLPAGMGTALWSSTLFAALLGLTGDEKTLFITTWLALSGGLPDMFRTATNCTCDGFTAIMFSRWFRSRESVGKSPVNTGAAKTSQRQFE